MDLKFHLLILIYFEQLFQLHQQFSANIKKFKKSEEKYIDKNIDNYCCNDKKHNITIDFKFIFTLRFGFLLLLIIIIILLLLLRIGCPRRSPFTFISDSNMSLHTSLNFTNNIRNKFLQLSNTTTKQN